MLSQQELDDMDNELLFIPHWASKEAKGDYTLPNAALPTKDGRRTGNAVMIGLADRQWDNCPLTYLIVTDAGNIIRANENEMKELFHPPEWCMKNLLPAHINALRGDTDE